ncbi:hypothetical protein [Serratia sp. Ag2]|uniref:hypothetical protein n=1 Tax=Serratia sp. Ag2 TaxID=1532556 RepID=UPI001267C6BE|nr:hypothetical protein [Serratia sp. Ag2]
MHHLSGLPTLISVAKNKQNVNHIHSFSGENNTNQQAIPFFRKRWFIISFSSKIGYQPIKLALNHGQRGLFYGVIITSGRTDFPPQQCAGERPL